MLTFPSSFPRVTIVVMIPAAVGLILLARAPAGRPLRAAPGPLYYPWLILAVWMLVGCLVTPAPDLTLPKAAAMVLGMLVLRGVLVTATTSRRIWLLSTAYLLAGTAMAIGALLAGPRWIGKFPLLESLYILDRKIPRVLLGLPGAESGVNSTALGGATLWLLPVAAILALHGPQWIRVTLQRRRGRSAAVLGTLGCAVAALTSFFVLLLSQARGAWIAAAVVAVLVPAFRWQKMIWLGAVGATTGLIAWLWLGPFSVSAFVGPERPFIWSLAVDALRADPLAGVGLGAFRMMAGPALDAGIAERFPVAHAHNVFLQVALDVGIPGLAAYLALLAIATRLTYDMVRSDADSHHRVLCLGLWANLVGIHVFGLADAIALGTKVGIFLWWNLGLIAALHAFARRAGNLRR